MNVVSPCGANWERFVAETKCFWTKSETFFVSADTKFVSATNVARAGKQGNICVGNNVFTLFFCRVRVRIYCFTDAFVCDHVSCSVEYNPGPVLRSPISLSPAKTPTVFSWEKRELEWNWKEFKNGLNCKKTFWNTTRQWDATRALQVAGKLFGVRPLISNFKPSLNLQYFLFS